jgi:hypothetical protein
MPLTSNETPKLADPGWTSHEKILSTLESNVMGFAEKREISSDLAGTEEPIQPQAIHINSYTETVVNEVHGVSEGTKEAELTGETIAFAKWVSNDDPYSIAEKHSHRLGVSEYTTIQFMWLHASSSYFFLG